MTPLDPRVIERAALAVGLGRTYGHTGAATQDCIRLTYACLQWAAGPRSATHLALNRGTLHLNTEHDGIGSMRNTATLAHLGLGVYPDPSVPLQPGVYYVQGWRGSRGHNFFLLVYEDNSVWILEATNSDADTDKDGVPDRHDWYRQVSWDVIVAKYPTTLSYVLLTEDLLQ